jgi:hypothetical protein
MYKKAMIPALLRLFYKMIHESSSGGFSSLSISSSSVVNTRTTERKECSHPAHTHTHTHTHTYIHTYIHTRSEYESARQRREGESERERERECKRRKRECKRREREREFKIESSKSSKSERFKFKRERERNRKGIRTHVVVVFCGSLDERTAHLSCCRTAFIGAHLAVARKARQVSTAREMRKTREQQ